MIEARDWREKEKRKMKVMSPCFSRCVKKMFNNPLLLLTQFSKDDFRKEFGKHWEEAKNGISTGQFFWSCQVNTFDLAKFEFSGKKKEKWILPLISLQCCANACLLITAYLLNATTEMDSTLRWFTPWSSWSYVASKQKISHFSISETGIFKIKTFNFAKSSAMRILVWKNSLKCIQILTFSRHDLLIFPQKNIY